eukprot:1157320-Pelagomonas_calceolata.AAC.2
MKKTLAHLPRLRDLDGPLSEDDDDSAGSNGVEQEGGSSSDADEQQPEGEGDQSDDGAPLPHLPQISDEGLPGGSRVKRGAEVVNKGEAGSVEEAGGNGRLVRSALDMLEELERACYASASRASSTSLRASMSRAMRSVAEHPAMRPWRSTAGGLGGATEAAREVGGLGEEGALGSRRSGDLAAVPSRPGSGGGAAGVPGRPESGGGFRGVPPQGAAFNSFTGTNSSGSPYLGLLPGGEPAPLESGTAPSWGGRALRPVTPPASTLPGLRSSSARLGPLEYRPQSPLLPTPADHQGCKRMQALGRGACTVTLVTSVCSGRLQIEASIRESGSRRLCCPSFGVGASSPHHRTLKRAQCCADKHHTYTHLHTCTPRAAGTQGAPSLPSPGPSHTRPRPATRRCSSAWRRTWTSCAHD